MLHVMTPIATLKPHSSDRKVWLVQSSYEDMGANYDRDPKNVSKLQNYLSYTSCVKMIKNTPYNIGLK